jgi:hypothetical protein
MSCNDRQNKCCNRYQNIDFDEGTPNRFDLEDNITRQLDIIDNLNILIENILERDTVNVDKVCSALLGIVEIHKMRHEKLWTTFTNLFELDMSPLCDYNDSHERDVNF